MDRNQATGLLLIALLVLLYFQFFAPDPRKIDEAPRTETTESTQRPAEISPTPSDIQLPDSLRQQKAYEEYGVFSSGAEGQAQDIVVENDQLRITFTSHGAMPSTVLLKDFNTYQGDPLYLFTPETNEMDLMIQAGTRTIDLTNLYYQSSQETINDTTILTFTLPLMQGGSVTHRYAVPQNGYQIGYSLKITGSPMSSDVVLQWNNDLKLQEKDMTLSRTNSTVNYYTVDEDFDGLNERSTDAETETLETPLKWVAIKQRFFISAIIANDSFSSGVVASKADPDDSVIVKSTEVKLIIPQAAVQQTGEFTFYFGPNDYHILKDVTEEFSKNLYLGWPPMIWVNKWVLIPLFDLLNNFIGNYGVIIIVMVLLIKLVLSPLSYKSYLSMAKMKVLKPQLDEIKERHPDDMAKAQQEQMKLYQQVGVNPISGCIPMLLQMPILFAMFYFFPQSIELRGEPFLWAEDLSTYDSILQLPFEIPFYGSHVSLFVLLMTVSTVLYTWSNQQVSSVTGPMKTISYMMPVIFMFVLNSYPAALSFYYFISNIVTFGQQALIRRFVDDEKIKTILEENKRTAGSRKKSKFQQKLEDAMKAQKEKEKPSAPKKKKN
jgi:YidC/Oxa1 family membrane protein insertase